MSDLLSDCFSISVFGLETNSDASPKLCDSISALDLLWRGEGSSTTQLDVVPAGIAPFGAYSHSRDRLIVQLQGRQRMQVFFPTSSVAPNTDYQPSPDNAASAGVRSYPLHSRGPHPIVVHRVDFLNPELAASSSSSSSAQSNNPAPGDIVLDEQLSTGDVVFVPKDYVVFTEPVDDSDGEGEVDTGSVSVSICLAEKPSVALLAQEALGQALQTGHASFPSSADETYAAAAATLECALATFKSQFYSKAATDRINSRTKFSWCNYNVHRWIRSRYGDSELEKLIEESGGLVKIRDFLPTAVAESIHEQLLSLNRNEWVRFNSPMTADLCSPFAPGLVFD